MSKTTRSTGALLLIVATSLALLPAAYAGDPAAREFERWFGRYKANRVDLYQAVESGYAVRTDDGGVRVEYFQSEGIAEFDRLLEALRVEGGLRAARLLLDAAVHELARDPAAERRRFIHQQPWLVRRRAAETLGGLEGDDVRSFLRETALRDRSAMQGEARRRVAVSALGRMRDADSVPAIRRRLADDAAPTVRSAAAESLGRIGGPAARAALEEALDDTDASVRLEVLLALARPADVPGATDATDPEDDAGEDAEDAERKNARLAAARALLQDPAWSVRLTAARILGEHPDVESIPPLLTALLNERPLEEGTRRRVRSAIRDALGRLTGEDFPATRPDEWVAWWAEHAADHDLEALEPRPEVPPEQGARFFGIPVEADEIVFLIDVSGSMDRPAEIGSNGPSRLFIARREVHRCLESLEDGTRFNLVLFHERIVPFRPEPVAKCVDTVAAARAFLDAVEPDGGTNLFGALEFSLGLDDEPTAQLLGTDLDTIVVLSDGKPSRGAVLVPDEILHQIEDSNRHHRIAIHTVSAGASSPFLESLARHNYGAHAALSD